MNPTAATDTHTHTADADTAAPADPRDRAVSPYTAKEKILRVLWMMLGQPVFRLTFHNWYALRAAMLRLFGATVGPRVRVRPSVIIEQPWNLTIGENSAVGDRAIVYCLGPVTIGEHVSISQGAHICAGTHDYSRDDLPLLRPPVVIRDHAWIAADAFVGPGITVGEGAVLGARAAAFKDVEPWTVYAGTPARPIKPRPRAGSTPA